MEGAATHGPVPSSHPLLPWPCLHADAGDDTTLCFPCSSSRSHERQPHHWLPCDRHYGMPWAGKLWFIMAKETTLLLSAVATIPLHTYILALTLHGGAPAGWALACHRLIPTLACHRLIPMVLRFGRFAYKLYFFNQRTIFFSHNKSVNGTFNHGLSGKRTGH